MARSHRGFSVGDVVIIKDDYDGKITYHSGIIKSIAPSMHIFVFHILDENDYTWDCAFEEIRHSVRSGRLMV